MNTNSYQFDTIMQKLLIQVISSSPQDSRTIQDCHADRIQLVSALQIGGVTPSSTIIRKSLEAVQIPTHVIIRHHNNGFFYTEQQKQLLLQDIRMCKQYKAAGVVVGSLNKSNSNKQSEYIQPDCNFIQNIVKETGGKMNVIFHKASDSFTDYSKSVDRLFGIGINCILTQGGTKSILDNQKQLLSISKNQWPNILLGGGVNHQNKSQIISRFKPHQIHIGTCVRQGKYGCVDSQMLKQFMNIV